MAKEQNVSMAGEQSENSIVIRENQVKFDSEGRAIIKDKEIVEFLKEKFRERPEIHIAKEVNVNCGDKCTINVFCKPTK